MRTSLKETLEKTNILVIDGSMSTALEALGMDLSNKLWSATALIEHPEKIKEVHKYYFRAGAQCGITCSYQASIPGLMEAGYTEKEAEDYITLSVELFKQARQEWWDEEASEDDIWPLCLGAVGPYGAYLADGSEYKGQYKISDEELRHFHKRRIELLWDAGADLILFETDPSLREALIEANLAEELGVDYWISFSCRDDIHTYEGQEIKECAIALKDHPHLQMIGVNCTYPTHIENLIITLTKYADVPVAVYPNSGDIYDPKTKTWSPNKEHVSFKDFALLWMKAGAKGVGGCCTTKAEHVSDIKKAKEIYLSDQVKKIKI